MPARRSIKHPCRPATTPSIRFCANASRPHESSRGARQMSRSMWALDNIGPELTKAFDAAGSRTPKRRIADEQTASERVWPGLKQGVEGCAVTNEGMRWCRQIDLLTGQNIELDDGVSDAFELRQMRVQIECADAP